MSIIIGYDISCFPPCECLGMERKAIKVNMFRKHNASQHRTNDYENNTLVVRRGGRLLVGVTYEGIKLFEIQRAVLRFNIEPKPEDVYNVVKYCRVEKKIDESKWSMVIAHKDADKKNIIFEINIPVHVAIGRYSADIIIPLVSLTPLKQFKLIVIFNPWNKGDEVYLGVEELRKEYILCDTGIIYLGHINYGPNGIDPVQWNFGQFEENVLDCVLDLLEKDQSARRDFRRMTSKRNNPVYVARRLSAMLNSPNENGLLVGNWSGNYEGGVPPLRWDGSVEIFNQYFETGKPVKYGQCWVFSGVMTTALRALGIPARSVTNYVSAHDTDGTMTIDVFYNEDGDKIEELSKDSVWNFHVWNEIWTKRKDLPGDRYDGWQAVDATPQEESAQLYQMGPAPLKAVKDGEIYAGFDTGFLFAEVNADYVNWVAKLNENGEDVVQKVSNRYSRYVGRFISTKMVGKDEREDITHLYKYPENSAEERKAFATAYGFGKGPETWMGEFNIEEEGKELTIDLRTVPSTLIPNGESFTCIIDVKNVTQHKLVVNLTGVINSVLYTGEVKTLVKRSKFDWIIIDPGKHAIRKVHISPGDYLDKLFDLNSLKFVVVAKVLNTGKQYVDDVTFQLSNKGSIEIEFMESPMKVGKRTWVAVSFTNTLPVPLSGISFTIQGAGLAKPQKRHSRTILRSGEVETMGFYIIPSKPGRRKLLVDIEVSQANNFKAFADIVVVEP